MKIGIMQPYFFPYLGYWQLMNYVDTYVIFDDVAYIKRGWINRNQIKINGAPQRIGISIHNASQNSKINELFLADSNQTDKLMKSLEMAYKKAPYYEAVSKLVLDCLNCGEKNLARFLAYSIRSVAQYLGMDTRFLLSSEIEKDESLRAQEKILDICTRLGGDTYINAIGGQQLYDFDLFARKGVTLAFLKMDENLVYPQGKGSFVPFLSIIDVMMYNSPEEIKVLLNQFSLIGSDSLIHPPLHEKD